MAKKPTYEELAQEITRHRQYKNELLFKEDIIRSSSSVIATCDLKGNMTFGNPSFLKAWGFDDTKEFLGRHFSEFWVVKDRLDEIMQALKSEGRWFGEIQARRKDGTLFHVQVSAAMVYDAENNPIALTSTSIDITERKRAEEALQESKDLFASQFELGNIGMALTAPDKGWVNVNKKLCNMLGYSKEELLKMNWAEITYPEDLQKDVTQFDKVLAGEIEGYELDKRFIKKNGGIIFTHLTVACIRDSDKSLKYIIASLQDITEQKAAEKALRESEKKFHTLFDLSPLAIAVSEWKPGKLIDVNSKFCELTKSTPEEVLGKTTTELKFYSEHNRNRFIKELEASEETHGLEMEFKLKDASVIYALMFAKLIRVAGKELIFTVFYDLTERKRAEEALRESRAQLQAILDYSPTLISIKDLEGNVVLVNRNFKVLDGPPPEAFVGKNVFDLFPKDVAEALWKNDLAALEAGGPVEAEETLRHKDGSWHTYLTVKFPLFRESETPFGTCAISTDITDRKNLEQRFIESQKMEAIVTLAGGIAHEFNNALFGVIGHIQLLQMDFPEDETIKKYSEGMNAATRRMTNLTDQLLAYAQVGKYRPKNFSLNEFVENTLPLIKHRIGPEISLETDLSTETCSINADLTQLQMVLSAVLLNASEAIEGKGRIKMSTGTVKLHEEISEYPRDLQSGTYARLIIEDDGKGMDEETRSRIFEPFFTTKFQGRGLGMAASYGIIKNHDGTIFVDSEKDKGTRVHIYLPVVEERPERIKDPGKKVHFGTETILVIEDETIVMDVTRAMLDKLGYRVLEAKTGNEAIDIAENFDGDIDLALLDIKLPDMEGGRIYPMIRKARPNLKVIVCSGHVIDGPAQEILNSGAQDFIQKPFPITLLSEKLRKILGEENK